MKNDIEYKTGKFARWRDFEKFWELENRRRLHLNPKIAANHWELPDLVGVNMKVNLARIID
jgi:hypothetical protein